MNINNEYFSIKIYFIYKNIKFYSKLTPFKHTGVFPEQVLNWEYIEDKIQSLKKLRFTQEYEQLQDRDTYEWMKYKVAAEVGGDAEKEAFKLFEKLKVD